MMHSTIHQPAPEAAGTSSGSSRTMVADRVYDALREMLMQRQLEPGGRLNLNQLARELHVSNTPIRQALGRLEAEGLVTREPNRGFAASPLLDVRAIAELYDFRLLLEPKCAARAARRGGPAFAETLDELTDAGELDRLLADPRAAETARQRDFTFHAAIAGMAGNRVVANHLGSALRTMNPYTLYHSSPAVLQAWEEHRAVADAIKAGDAERAAQAMRVHLSNSRDRLSEAIV